MLTQARSPLIYGLSSTATEAQRCAVELADRLGAILDTTSSLCHGPAVLAMQSVGLPGCTLGEIRSNADLVIFWGCNPAVSHPRHFARYSLPPANRRSRVAVVVDVRPTATSDIADLFLQVEPGSDLEILTALRALVHARPLSARAIGGVPLANWEDLAGRMKSCRMGVVFAGVGLTMSQGRDLNLGELFSLVAELNDCTRFAAMPMRGHGNVAGADQVLTWQSGYPFAVNYGRGFPRYGPGEFSAVDVLAHGEADAALIIASDPLAHLPSSSAVHLREIPVVAIDPRESLTTRIAQVVLPTACYGLDAAGTYYRMDGVPIRLRPVISSARPTDEQALQQLLDSVVRVSAGAVPTC
jgi:formylmethanofuran dehydrogenase subunit B